MSSIRSKRAAKKRDRRNSRKEVAREFAEMIYDREAQFKEDCELCDSVLEDYEYLDPLWDDDFGLDIDAELDWELWHEEMMDAFYP